MASVIRKPRSPFWWAAITMPNGKRRQFSTKLTDKDEALEVAVRAEKAYARHKAEDQLRKALGHLIKDVVGSAPVEAPAFFDDWLKRRSKETSEATGKSYELAVREIKAFMVANERKDLSDITVNDVLKLRDEWAEKNSVSTANGKLKTLRMALKDAVLARMVHENVAAHVRNLKKPEKAKGEKRRAFLKEELFTLLAACAPDWKTLCLLGLYTGGQRFGDLATLRWRDVDVLAGVIATSARKTKHPIILPIVPALSDALALLDGSDDPKAFLFPEIAALSQQARSKRFRRILVDCELVPRRTDRKTKGEQRESREKKKRGEKTPRGKNILSELSFHSFRHTATSMLKAAGVGEGIAKAIVGHESQAISDHYTSIPMETMREALEKLGRF